MTRSSGFARSRGGKKHDEEDYLKRRLYADYSGRFGGYWSADNGDRVAVIVAMLNGEK